MGQYIGDINIPDGSSITLGATGDVAVGDAAGTVNAHIRQLDKLFANVNFLAAKTAGTTAMTPLSVARAFANELQEATTTVINSTAATVTLVTSGAAQKIYVVGYNVVVGAATTVNLEDDAATVILGKQSFAANGGIAIAGTLDCPIAVTAVGKALVIRQSGTAQMGGTVTTYQF